MCLDFAKGITLMQVQTKIPAFDDFSGMLAQADVMASPAELHGILAGMISIGHKLDGKFWFDIILKRLATPTCVSLPQRRALIDLYDKTCRQLNDFNAEFQLLLPDEQQSFSTRAEALSRWCAGFLYGLQLEESLSRPITNDLRNALRCIAEIAQLDFNKIEVDDHDQPAYGAAVECVRAAVLTAYSEFSDKSNCLH